jgi:hypothetical protein
MSSSNTTEPFGHGSASSFGKLPDSRMPSTSVTIKGLPPDHPRAYCMGEYTKTERSLHDRSVYVGGRDDNMALWFDGIDGWVVSSNVGGEGFTMIVKDSAATPDRITSPWLVDLGKKPDPSVRFRKYKSRETTCGTSYHGTFNNLVITGLSAQHVAADCMGRYTRQARTYGKKPLYKGGRNKNMSIWFEEEGNCWCVGSEEEIGSTLCCMCAFDNDNAPTPDAVLSTWNVDVFPEVDDRIRACCASTEATIASQPQQQHYAPPTIAVVGLDASSLLCAGMYTKQQRKEGGMAVYEGGRDGKRAIWHHQNGWWCVGEMVHIGTASCYMYVNDPAAVSPNATKELWQVSVMKPCSCVRVTKSKKKHTKVVEVKGVPTDAQGVAVLNGKYRQQGRMMAVLNGKYRQQGRMIGGRPTFKGGQYGCSTLWYDEHHGKWCATHERFVGVSEGLCTLEAKDTALTPDKVKATWQVISGFEPSLYPNIIVPSVEAVKQEEVPRLMQLKMSELVAAQHRRCLGCGHEYTAAAEVVFHCSCMHHHCVCCGEVNDGACALCEEEKTE